MKITKTVSLEELRAMKDRGEIASPAKATEAPELPVDFWETAQVELPKTKKAVSMRVDPDILEFFKSQGGGHLTKMHSVLRAYVDAHKKLSAE